jgi:hypothetical protein
MLELTPRERRHQANLRRNDFWGLLGAGAALVLPAVSIASDCE